MFEQMRSDGVISTRGLKADAEKFGELIFDVNSAYFFNHGAMNLQNNFTPMPTKLQSKLWAASSTSYRRSCTPTSATAPCRMLWGGTCTTTTFMWSIFLS